MTSERREVVMTSGRRDVVDQREVGGGQYQGKREVVMTRG